MQLESLKSGKQQDGEISPSSPQHTTSVSTNSTSCITSSATATNQKVPCGGCGKSVTDSSILFVDELFWHVTCLKCCACALLLSDKTSCFVKNGNIYCREHYYENFLSPARSCARCGYLINSHEYVMKVRDKVYHAVDSCFCCSKCERPLVRGEKFTQDTKKLYCFECFHPSVSFCSESPEISANKPGRPRKTKHSLSTQRPSHLPANLGYEEELHCAHERRGYESQKSKRIRTSFKHHQLCAMKAYFDSNHNPDAKDLKQLAQETGLTKRVLQVWFQNARAKYRRNCLQNEGKSENKPTKNAQMDTKKSDTSMDLSCSDSVSSTFEVSPVSESTSEEMRPFYEDMDSESMTSYSDYQLQNPIENQLSSPMENINRTLTSMHTSLHTSSPKSSLASSV